MNAQPSLLSALCSRLSLAAQCPPPPPPHTRRRLRGWGTARMGALLCCAQTHAACSAPCAPPRLPPDSLPLSRTHPCTHSATRGPALPAKPALPLPLLLSREGWRAARRDALLPLPALAPSAGALSLHLHLRARVGCSASQLCSPHAPALPAPREAAHSHVQCATVMHGDQRGGCKLEADKAHACKHQLPQCAVWQAHALLLSSFTTRIQVDAAH
eukprot:1267166-Rhodomonas_salina.3